MQGAFDSQAGSGSCLGLVGALGGLACLGESTEDQRSLRLFHQSVGFVVPRGTCCFASNIPCFPRQERGPGWHGYSGRAGLVQGSFVQIKTRKECILLSDIEHCESRFLRPCTIRTLGLRFFLPQLPSSPGSSHRGAQARLPHM